MNFQFSIVPSISLFLLGNLALLNDSHDNSPTAMSFSDLDPGCLVHILSFVGLEFVPIRSSEVENHKVGVKDIVSFQLVSKATHEAFTSCDGWLLLAKALKGEYIGKRKQMRPNLKEAWGHIDRGVGPLVRETQEEAYAFHRELEHRVSTMMRRCFFIRGDLLPTANHYVVANGGEKVIIRETDTHHCYRTRLFSRGVRYYS
jgi:hypothetical protein